MRNAPRAAQSAGHIFLARLNYLRTLAGEPLVDRVLARLSKDDQATLRGLILPISWFPIELNDRLDQAMADELSRGDRDLVFLEMGRASADANLGGPHKGFVQKGDPHYLLRMVPQNYRLSYTQGHMEYEVKAPNAGIARVFGAHYTQRSHCLTNLGWLKRGIELSGGKQARATDPMCTARGDPHCEYHVGWTL